MMSGDGLVLRVRPRLGRLSADEARRFCELADRYGNGMIDVTTRANLQIRGVTGEGHSALLDALMDAGLVDSDARVDARRNIVATPFWNPGDLTDRMGAALEARLPDLPDLPAKVGFALDTGPAAMLSAVSADFRFEGGDGAPLILRADGASRGVSVTERTAVGALMDMAEWFARSGGCESGRMSRHVARVAWPDGWDQPAPVRPFRRVDPGAANGVRIFGVPFGQTTARDLGDLVTASGATHLRVTPWRMLALEQASDTRHPAFISHPEDPVLGVSACPGAPLCPQASVRTRALARKLAGLTGGTLHVSGCAKGCAWQGGAALTIVGCAGTYDVVRDGHAWDAPFETGLSDTDILNRFAR